MNFWTGRGQSQPDEWNKALSGQNHLQMDPYISGKMTGMFEQAV